MFELEHTELSEKVYQLIKKMILNREFHGGEKLDLTKMTKKMNISRTPLKDAVNRLVHEGLVEVKPRSGTFVTSLKAADIEEVMEIRFMIEKWCVSRITAERAVHLAQELEAIMHQFANILQADPFPYEYFLELDVKFHYEIVRSGGNQRMLEQYKSANSFLHAARIYYFQSYGRSIAGHDEHMAIADAIKRYDIEDACRKLEVHLLNSKMSMLDHLQKNGGFL